ncbi:putative mitochondrial acidic protein MAM33 [Iris pallida]|uniref:Mitochondrial acidic protein MAM33 n=1 Tax=Iris pallida TaxID=29817 RepID=A0AAX6II74_IRIPA|nr:putative mitochondrial acidic protein MAM33 [Iris pallida]
MSLRQAQRRTAAPLRYGRLLRVLRSEISHELSSSPPPLQSQAGISVGDFVVDWDDARAQDVLLRRRAGPEEEEEVAVSGLLGPLRFDGEDPAPREALVKVVVKKAGLDPALHFHCRVFDGGFSVGSARYHSSVADLGPDKYRGPSFSTLDPLLQNALKGYLAERGINEELTAFLLQHLCQKEDGQYLNWLRTVEGFVTKGS